MKLPPVRRRASYADIPIDSLVAALFSDRVLADPVDGAPVEQPGAPVEAPAVEVVKVEALDPQELRKEDERDYTRDDTGKFSESPGGGPAKPKPKPKETGGTPQERANRNRESMSDALGVPPELDGALVRLAAGMGGAKDEANADQLVERGLAVKDPDTGKYTLSPAGKKYYAAARAGNTEGATAALANGKIRAEKAKARAERAAGRAAKPSAPDGAARAALGRLGERARGEKPAGPYGRAVGAAAAGNPDSKAKEKEKKKGGGGGAKEKKDPEAARREKIEANRANVAGALANRPGGGLDPIGAQSLATFADGIDIPPDMAGRLADMGLLEQDSAGAYRMTPAGAAVSSAMDRGNIRGALDALSRSRDMARKLWFTFDEDSIAKMDPESADSVEVVGYASTPEIDRQPGVYKGQRYDGDIVDPQALQEALAGYMEYANVRAMHENRAVGTVTKAEPLPDGRLRITARIVDSDAIKKIRARVYKGFSIGGRLIRAILQKMKDGRIARVITALELTEISLVDRPANPGARILLFKREATMAGEPTPLDQLMELMKAAPDPMKIIGSIQTMRDEIELAGDPEGAALMTQAIALILQAAGEASPPAAESEVESEVEMMDDAAGDEEAVMMSSRADLLKASRLRMGKRLDGIERAARDLLKLAADSGSVWAAGVLKAETIATVEDAMKAIGADLRKGLEVIAGATIGIAERVDTLERQPVGGGPIGRAAAPGALTKRLDAQPPTGGARGAQSPADQIVRLQRLVAIEVNPAIRAGYVEQLAALQRGS